MTDDPSALPPAGWHPDPGGAPMLLRWWTGASWTDHTRPYGEQPISSNRPAASASPVAPTPYTPFATTAVVERSAPQKGRAGRVAREREIRRNNGYAYAGLALAVVGLIVNLFGIPGILAIVFSAIGLARANRLHAAGFSATGFRMSILGGGLGGVATFLMVTRIAEIVQNSAA